MDKFIKRISNLVITGLMALAIFQINRLWFEESLSHNFFYILSNQSTFSYDSKYYTYFTMPERIITSFGNNQFSIAYTSIEQSGTRQIGDKIINELAKNGNYDNVYEADYDVLLKSRSIIYEYAFTMKSTEFTVNYSARNNPLAKAAAFDSVYIIPSEQSSSLINVFFLDSASNSMYSYTLDNIGLSDELRGEIQSVQKDQDNTDIYYVSSKILKLNIEDNVFLPRWRNDGKALYYPVQASRSYYENDELTKAGLRKALSIFFDSPSTVREPDNNDIYTFSDSYTVVKYYTNDILEYTSTRINQQNKGSSLMDDFAQAMTFIKKDTMMASEIYFAGFDEIGSTRTFYFDYVANNQKVLISDSLTASGLKHGIEVTIVDGTLNKYKKFSYNFSIEDTVTKEADLDVLMLIDDIEVYDINFGYKLAAFGQGEAAKELPLNVGIIGNENSEVFTVSVTTNNTEPEL